MSTTSRAAVKNASLSWNSLRPLVSVRPMPAGSTYASTVPVPSHRAWTVIPLASRFR
ncbi:hypothetical protein OG205_19745 [Lentzea sp. NBC_00516]|uniref:hypothetical protein n=1 Tax=Lentzea sp. NBC_00516 TaxID=2903582 RepID=UPI002E81035F|nr:hypothetical protein [Lentzea sp. NBC_00516]WUD29153.1 hypothetical protein OG205_19745 [Lentzea sp. NBC_00516]